MDYDIVIATCNRLSILKFALSSVISQTHLPKSLVIVDSSENHAAVSQEVRELCKTVNTDLKIIKSPRGLTAQRNIGLKYVTSPVVIFPDDDVLWSPDTAKHILHIYELDHESAIGGVCGAIIRTPPESWANKIPYPVRDKYITSTIKRSLRRFLEKNVYPNPFTELGNALTRNRTIPTWLKNENASPVAFMQGFRMSFRTDLIKSLGFDETLNDYALFEDMDASFQILKTHLIVEASRAKIYHCRAPGARQDGLKIGVTHILNRTYLVCKHAHGQDEIIHHLRRYLRYTWARFLTQPYTTLGRQRIIGARRARSTVDKLIDASPYRLSATYLDVLSQCLR